MKDPEAETFPLDDAAIKTVAEWQEQRRAAQTALNAVLSYFARQHQLTGVWTLSENGRELVKQFPPVAQQVSNNQ